MMKTSDETREYTKTIFQVFDGGLGPMLATEAVKFIRICFDEVTGDIGGLPIVYADAANHVPPTVTLGFPEPVSLFDALEILALTACLRVVYYRAGIVLYPAVLDEAMSKKLRPDWQLRKEAMALVVQAYPSIGEPGSAANLAFLAGFCALGADPLQAEAIADLVMIYPPER